MSPSDPPPQTGRNGADSGPDAREDLRERFERDGLLALEQGAELDPELAQDPTCRELNASYQRLHGELRTLGADTTGRTDWQARVFAGVARRQSARTRQRWLFLAIPALAATAAAVVLLLQSPTGPDPTQPLWAYNIDRDQGDDPLRGGHAQPGDVIRVRAYARGAEAVEVRLYRDDQHLVGRCSQTACPNPDPKADRTADDSIAAAFTIEQRGRYQLVLVRGPASMPDPTGELDRDLAAANAAGGQVELVEIDAL